MSRPNFLSPAVFPLNLHRLSRFKAHSSNKWCNENVVFCFPQTASCWQSLPGAMMYVIEKFRWNLVGFGHCAPLISRWNPEPKNCWFGSFTIKHPGQVPNDQRTLYACYHWFVILYLQVVRSLHPKPQDVWFHPSSWDREIPSAGRRACVNSWSCSSLSWQRKKIGKLRGSMGTPATSLFRGWDPGWVVLWKVPENDFIEWRLKN